jgi:methylated-DNA-protein-cysteine methyltransferase-like protein
MSFTQDVLKIVSSIPYGKVATYGQVAAMAGSPRAARQVGFALAGLSLGEAKIPWWRVVNRHGYISIRNNDIQPKLEQKSWLEAEGVVVSLDLKIDLATYLWKPNP